MTLMLKTAKAKENLRLQRVCYEMASRKGIESSNWRPRSKLTAEIQLHLCGSNFNFDKELLASKSAKVAKILHANPHEDLCVSLHDIPADQESIEIVARFCHGFGIELTPENIIRVICVAQYLGMTERHCPENLQNKAVLFFEREILRNWTNCIKALKNSASVIQHAVKLGLVEHCVESIIKKVQDDPRLLGEPGENGDKSKLYKPNPRRKLFDICWKSEDLTSLSLELYEPIMESLIRNQVPDEYIAANLCEYARTWLFSGDETPIYESSLKRQIVEALVKMLPDEKGLIPCSFLFRLLQYTIALDATAECRNRLEMRIGKQLEQASPSDLLIPSHGYAKDEKYDTDCVRRILKHFYCNYTSQDESGLISVSELIDEFLSKISTDINMKISTFAAFADMSAAASMGTQRTCDGIYRAIDIYLDKHKDLTKSEREELCKVLDCNKMSAEALQHAAQNERLPVRVVVQALFVVQLKLRDTVAMESSKRVVKHEEEEEEDDEVRAEIEKMGSKVSELEKECCMMRREIERGNGKQKTSMWKEMKRKFGCVTTTNDCNCHVKKKKVHPR